MSKKITHVVHGLDNGPLSGSGRGPGGASSTDARKATTMRKTNVASSGSTAVQVGRIVPADEHDDTEPPAPRQRGGVTNVRSGNATVGRQADTIVGDVTIVQARR